MKNIDNRLKIGDKVHYKIDGDEYWSTIVGYRQELFTEELYGYMVDDFCNLGLSFPCVVPLEKITLE